MSQLNSTKIVVKVIIEVIGLLLLIATFIILNRKGPFHRGFYCDDEDLKHPYQDSQSIPSSFALMIWISLVLVTILPIEFLRNLMISTRPYLPRLCGVVPLPWILVDIYRTLGHCILGGLATLLITEIAKITIGRLRPHFLTLCKPDYEACMDEEQKFFVFVTNETEVCTSLQLTEDETEFEELVERMEEGRLSFLSGHSSFSFYNAIFLTLFLQSRLDRFPVSNPCADSIRRYLKVVRPFIQAFFVMLAFYISLTRISDYFHHPLDVSFGALLGVTMGILTHTYSKIDRQPVAFGSHFSQDSSRNSRPLSIHPGNMNNIHRSSKTMEDFVRAT